MRNVFEEVVWAISLALIPVAGLAVWFLVVLPEVVLPLTVGGR